MIIGLIAISTFFTVSLFLWGLLRRGSSLMEARMESFRQQALMSVEGETDLSVPFGARIIKPTIAGLARLATSILPASVLTNIEKQLVMAGNPMSANAFAVMWMVLAVTFAGMVLLVGLVVSLPVFQLALAVLLFGLMGLMLPLLWLRGRVGGRQRLILRALPDAMDLITTCVEAGLGLDAALSRVTEKSSGPLADELSRTLREMAMGRLRREALTDLGKRTGVEELIIFTNAVIQAEQLGVGIAQVLRVQAEQLRTRRRQRAEQAAHEASIKMIFPLVLFIFPSFMLVILGPAVIRIGEALF